MIYPTVLSEDDTLDRALGGASLARFGDGELRLARGGDCISQVRDPRLEVELKEILAGDYEGQVLACIPNAEAPTPKGETWATYEAPAYVSLYGSRLYGSSFITRPDSAPWIDRPDYWAKVRALWEEREVILVAGTEKSITADMLSNAARVRQVEAPRRDAYARIDSLEWEITEKARLLESPLVLLCIGATSTVLAARLARRGIQALDLGHMGMFMKHAGAYASSPDDLASPGYRATLKAKHAETRWGNSGASWVPEVKAFAEELGATSILDYGCGRGTLATAMKPTRVQEYDPGIKGKDVLPKPVDLLVSTDVLEHIEPDRLDAVLAHMHRLAAKGAFLVISCRLAREILPDGRNAHLIVQPPEWWLGTLARHGWKIERSENRKGLIVWLRK